MTSRSDWEAGGITAGTPAPLEAEDFEPRIRFQSLETQTREGTIVVRVRLNVRDQVITGEAAELNAGPRACAPPQSQLSTPQRTRVRSGFGFNSMQLLRSAPSGGNTFWSTLWQARRIWAGSRFRSWAPTRWKMMQTTRPRLPR
jgi:hypothetical protein